MRKLMWLEWNVLEDGGEGKMLEIEVEVRLFKIL